MILFPYSTLQKTNATLITTVNLDRTGSQTSCLVSVSSVLVLYSTKIAKLIFSKAVMWENKSAFGVNSCKKGIQLP